MVESLVNAVQHRGPMLPVTRDGKGYFASGNPYEVAWTNLVITILTPIGSRPMNRAFGSALSFFLFEARSPEFVQQAENAIYDAVERWCPTVVIENITVSVPDQRRHVGFQITYSLKGDPRTETRVLVSQTHNPNMISA